MPFSPIAVGGRIVRTPTEVYQLYVPQTIKPELWTVLRPNIVQAAQRYYAPAAHGARSAMYACTKYALWCYKNGISTTDPEVQYHPENVSRFIHHGCRDLSDSTRATIRCVLEAVGYNSTRRAPWPEPPTPIKARKKRADPYTQDQMRQFVYTASVQFTDRRALVLMVLLALGHGAGLATGELISVEASHLDMTNPGHPIVHVPSEEPRSLPILPRYSNWLQQIVRARPEGPLIGQTAALHDKLSHLRKGISLPSALPPLTTSRLRTTWLLHHLNVGTPLNVIASWSGVKSLSSFAELLPFMDAEPARYPKLSEELPFPEVVA